MFVALKDKRRALGQILTTQTMLLVRKDYKKATEQFSQNENDENETPRIVNHNTVKGAVVSDISKQSGSKSYPSDSVEVPTKKKKNRNHRNDNRKKKRKAERSLNQSLTSINNGEVDESFVGSECYESFAIGHDESFVIEDGEIFLPLRVGGAETDGKCMISYQKTFFCHSLLHVLYATELVPTTVPVTVAEKTTFIESIPLTTSETHELAEEEEIEEAEVLVDSVIQTESVSPKVDTPLTPEVTVDSYQIKASYVEYAITVKPPLHGVRTKVFSVQHRYSDFKKLQQLLAYDRKDILSTFGPYLGRVIAYHAPTRTCDQSIAQCFDDFDCSKIPVPVYNESALASQSSEGSAAVVSEVSQQDQAVPASPFDDVHLPIFLKPVGVPALPSADMFSFLRYKHAL